MKQHEIDRHRNMSTQLGMPRGTAANRLRKLVLFDLLKKHNENICYRCKKEIESVEELSIEHIKSWENVDVKLFWDLANISFSHLSCNCAAGAKKVPIVNPTPRKVGLEGTSWCRTHKLYLPVESFAKSSRRWNNLRYDCRECEKKYKDSIRHPL